MKFFLTFVLTFVVTGPFAFAGETLVYEEAEDGDRTYAIGARQCLKSKDKKTYTLRYAMVTNGYVYNGLVVNYVTMMDGLTKEQCIGMLKN